MGMLDGKIVLITGAGAGIGKQAIKVSVREGATVIAVDFSGEEKTTAAEFGDKVIPINCDISKDSDIVALFETVKAKFGRVDVVMNVAGTHGRRAPGVLNVEEFEKMTAVNLRGLLFITQLAVPIMIANGGGAFVNVSSISSVNVESRTSFMYASAKAGVNALTKSVAVEYGKQGIRANAIAPGYTRTEFMGAEDDVSREMSQKAAIGRHGTALELAEVAVFLASDRASFVSGVVLPVDGGWSARLR